MTEKVFKIDDRTKINYAGWINNISDPFLFHLDSLFKIGSKREIDIHDLGLLPDTSRTNHVFNIILDNWKNEFIKISNSVYAIEDPNFVRIFDFGCDSTNLSISIYSSSVSE